MIRKKYCDLTKSPVYIIALICSIIAFIGVISNVIVQTYYANSAYFTYTGLIYAIIMIIALVPELLKIIGLIVFTAKSKSESSGGLGAIKASQIIMFVVIILCGVIASVGVIASAVNVSKYSRSSDAVTAIWTVVFAVIAVYVLAIIYYRCVIHTISVAKRAISRNELRDTPSLFVAVFNFLIGVVYMVFAGFVLLALFGVINNVPYEISRVVKAYSGYVAVIYIGYFASGLATFLYGILIIKARQISPADSGKDYYVEEAISNFCVFCGKPLAYGEECSCRAVEETPKRTTFCIYCGNTIYEGETCTCRGAYSEERTTTYIFGSDVHVEESIYNEERTEVPSEGAYKEFCIYCGKTLAGGEVCSCRTAATPTVFCTDCGRPLRGGEVCECKMSTRSETAYSGAGGSGLKSTMGKFSRSKTPEEERKIDEGKKFFSSGGSL